MGAERGYTQQLGGKSAHRMEAPWCLKDRIQGTSKVKGDEAAQAGDKVAQKLVGTRCPNSEGVRGFPKARGEG